MVLKGLYYFVIQLTAAFPYVLKIRHKHLIGDLEQTHDTNMIKLLDLPSLLSQTDQNSTSICACYCNKGNVCTIKRTSISLKNINVWAIQVVALCEIVVEVVRVFTHALVVLCLNLFGSRVFTPTSTVLCLSSSSSKCLRLHPSSWFKFLSSIIDIGIQKLLDDANGLETSLVI